MTKEDTAKQPSSRMRVVATAVIFMIGLLAMLGRLYFLQVVNHSVYLARMNTGSEVSVRIPAVRGEIQDRNGLTLAGNRPSYAIEFYMPDMLRNYRAENKKNVPSYEYMANVGG